MGKLTLIEIIFLHLALQILALIVTFVALYISGIQLQPKVDKTLAKLMLRFGSKVQVGDISQSANLRLDQALMAGLLPSTQLGLYVVAVSAAALPQALSHAVRIVIAPTIAQEESPAQRAMILEQMFRKYLIVGLTVTILIAGVLPWVIPMVYGAKFSEALWPAELLLLATLLGGAKEVLIGGAQALGNPWLGSRAELVALGITLVLLPFLLLKVGILGAAIATAAAYATHLIIMVHGLKRSHEISPRALFNLRFSGLVYSARKLVAGQ
jgi:O-antigen/teichoic acid export membrane protein